MNPHGAYEGSLLDFQAPHGQDLLARTEPFLEWVDARRAEHVWPFSKMIETWDPEQSELRFEDGGHARGVNFASQDYLSLSHDPAIIEAARDAAARYGVHSAGSTALTGITEPLMKLEAALSAFLKLPEVLVFPTGWGAGFGIIAGLVRQRDHVVVDTLAHACLQTGAHFGTQKFHRFRHNNAESLENVLHTIRDHDTENGILVVAEALYSMDADAPDIKRLQTIARRFDATLVVDVAHDLGALGENGGGVLEMQGALGEVDLVMGSFSKTFASNGGFVAARRPAVKQYLKFYSGPQTFSNAMSPVQAGIVLKAIEIVRSADGAQRRRKLIEASRSLRSELESRGLKLSGIPSAIVPVLLDCEQKARSACREVYKRGVLLNLVEYPAVPKGQPRFRMQLQSDHAGADMASVAARIAEACASVESAQAQQ